MAGFWKAEFVDIVHLSYGAGRLSVRSAAVVPMPVKMRPVAEGRHLRFA